MPRMTEGVKRARRSDAPIASAPHQAADPRRTPPASAAGLAGPPPPPRLSVAASAANEMTVAGLVIVSPSVETYAHGRPVLEVLATSAGLFLRSNRIRSPSPTKTAPPIRANGLRPPATRVMATAKPNAAIAAYRPSAV